MLADIPHMDSPRFPQVFRIKFFNDFFSKEHAREKKREKRKRQEEVSLISLIPFRGPGQKVSRALKKMPFSFIHEKRDTRGVARDG
jgi:hypothetical protein